MDRRTCCWRCGGCSYPARCVFLVAEEAVKEQESQAAADSGYETAMAESLGVGFKLYGATRAEWAAVCDRRITRIRRHMAGQMRADSFLLTLLNLRMTTEQLHARVIDERRAVPAQTRTGFVDSFALPRLSLPHRHTAGTTPMKRVSWNE